MPGRRRNCGMGSEGTVNILYRREIQQADDAEQARRVRIEEHEQKFTGLSAQDACARYQGGPAGP